MRFDWFLKMKHWQLFLLWIIPSIISGFASEYFYLVLILGLVYMITIIGWFYLAGKSIQSITRVDVKEKRPELWALVSIVSYSIAYGIFEFADPFSPLSYLTFAFAFIAVVPLIKLMLYSIDCISFAEGKQKRDNNLIIGFLFFIIGVWFIQPRINQIRNECATANNM